VHAWQVRSLTSAEFEWLRIAAEKQVAVKKKQAQRLQLKAAAPEPVAVKDLGVVIGPLSEEMMAEKLIWDAVVVKEVLPGAKTYLREGDVILTEGDSFGEYAGMDWNWLAKRAISCVANKFRDGYPIDLTVIRGDRIVKVSGTP